MRKSISDGSRTSAHNWYGELNKRSNPLSFFFCVMRQFRNKLTKEIFKLNDKNKVDKKIIESLENNRNFEELYELQEEHKK